MRVPMKGKTNLNKISAWLGSLLISLQPVVAYADVVIDESAAAGKKAYVDVAPNSVPIVNIAAPSQQGVSHNLFSEFSVDNEGLILNNSNGISQTQLGGLIAGNAQLGDRSARLIVNEVTGNNRSALMGITEVAGQSADYVLANPNGISCDGCGFINIPRATLATGTPNFTNGELTSLNITGGEFDLQGRGLNASNTGSLEILTRVANINAQLIADRLKIVTGSHQYNYSNRSAIALENEDAPQVSLDVSALGGMYANSISLIGTEAGVGVRVDGSLSAYGDDLVLTADGDIVARELWANDVIHINSHSGNVSLEDDITARQIDVIASETLTTNSENIVAGSALNLYAGSIVNNGNLISGVSSNNNNNPDASLVFRSEGTAINNGLIYSTGSSVVLVNSFENAEDSVVQSLGDLRITASNLGNAGAQIISAANMSVNVEQSVNNSAGIIVSTGGDIFIETESLDNEAGIINAAGELLINIDSMLDNAHGEIYAEDAVFIAGEGSLSNVGGSIDVGEGGEASLEVLGGMNNSFSAYLSEEFNLVLDVARLDNTGGQIIHSGEGEFILNIDNEIINSNGVIHSEGFTFLGTDSLNNENGQISSTLGLNLQVTDTINNHLGTLYTPGDLSIQTSELNNVSCTIVGNNVSLQAQLINNNQGQIVAYSALDAVAGSLTNVAGWMEAGSDFYFEGDNFDNSFGRVLSLGDMSFVVANTLNNTSGIVDAGANLNIAATTLQNASGTVLAAGNGDSSIEIGSEINNRGGSLASNANSFIIQAATLDNNNGDISHGGNQLFINIDDVINEAGVIESLNQISVSSGVLNNNNGLLWANEILIEGEQLTNAGGVVQADGNVFQIITDDLQNNNGLILQEGDGWLNLAGSGILSNVGGLINANGGLNIDFDELININGRVSGDNLGFSLEVLNNNHGILAANQLAVNAESFLNESGWVGVFSGEADALRLLLSGEMNNNSGYIESSGGSQIYAVNLSNTSGQLLAGQNLLLDVEDELGNQFGVVSSNASLNISAGNIVNSFGSISNYGSAASNLTVDLAFDNTDGLITSNSDSLYLQADTLINAWENDINRGVIHHAGVDTFTLQLNRLENDSGELASSASLVVLSNELNNYSGNIFASTVDIDTADLINTFGLIEGGSVDIFARGEIHNGEVMADNAALLAMSVSTHRGIRATADNGSLTINAAYLSNNYSNIQSNGDQVQITGTSLQNIGGLIQSTGAGDLQIDVSGNVFNRAGQIDSDAGLSITANNLSNTEGSLISSLDLLSLFLQEDLNNISSVLDTASALEIEANNLVNQGNVIAQGVGPGGQNSSLRVAETLFNSGALIAIGSSNFLVATNELNNSNNSSAQGLQHFGNGEFSIDASLLNNTSGNVVAAAEVTVTSNNLNNASGQLRAQTVNLQTETINNNQGILQGDNRVAINNSGDLNNSNGLILTLLSDEINALDIFVGGYFNNDNYAFVQSAGLTGRIQAGRFSNNTDALAPEEYGSHVSHYGSGVFSFDVANTFENNSGVIESQGELNIVAQSLNNQHGWLVSTGQLFLQSDLSLENGEGIVSGGGIELSSTNGSIINRNGFIQSFGSGASSVSSAEDFDNVRGSLYSEADELALTVVGDIINTAGTIAHSGIGGFTLSANNFYNTANIPTLETAWFGSNGHVIIDGVNTIQNTGVDVTNEGRSVFSAQRLTVNNLITLNNSFGILDVNGIAFDSLLTLQSLNNNYGLISAAGNVILDISSFRNTNGILSSNGSLQLTLPNFNFYNGLLNSASNITINTTGDLINTSGNQVFAGSDITINTDGDVRNFGILSTSGSLTLSGSDFENGSNATLSAAGNLQLFMDGLFTNNGLIVASTDLTISAQNFQNNNTLFADENINIYVNSLVTNSRGSEIFSMGNVVIAADEDLSHATVVENTSARITAFSGNMGVYADQIINQREFVDINERQLLNYSEEQIGHWGGACGQNNNCLIWEFRQVWNYIDEFVSAAPEAVISAGNNLFVEAVHLLNDASVLAAANDIFMVGDTLTNTGAPVYRTRVTTIRQEEENLAEGCNRCISYRNRSTTSTVIPEESVAGYILAGRDIVAYFNEINNVGDLGELLESSGNAQGQIQNLDVDSIVASTAFTFQEVFGGFPDAPDNQQLPQSEYQGGATNVGAQISTTGDDTLVNNNNLVNGAENFTGNNDPLLTGDDFENNTGVEGSGNDLNELANNSIADQSQANNEDLVGDLSEASQPRDVDSPQGSGTLPEVSIVDPTQDLVLPESALFEINDDYDADYLVQLGEAIRDYTAFVSSDYFLERLHLDPADMLKRLGDGFYEARLISDSIFSARGIRFLTNHRTAQRIASDNEQFHYLMDNAVEAAETLELAVGVALTSDQVARLTHDIVWLEEKEVNGQTVLAPVYYATSASSDVFNHGAVIAATDVQLWAENGFNNTGTISATNSVDLGTLQTMRNRGIIRGGNNVSIDAGSVINEQFANAGAVIQSENGLVSLSANNGNIENLRNAIIDGNLVTMQATAGSINNEAGSVRGRGAVVALARDNINNLSTMNQAASISGGSVFLTAEEGSINNLADEREWQTGSGSYRRTGVAANISADDNLVMTAGEDVHVRASNLLAGSGIDIEAGRDINIVSATNEVHTAGKGRNWELQVDRVENISSELVAGESVSLHAGRDSNLVGSNITSGGDVAIHSERDTNISVVNDVDHVYQYQRTKGSWGRSKTKESEHHVETVVGGTIEAAGSVAINARGTEEGLLTLESGNVNIAGGVIAAGEDVVIAAGNDINISATQTLETHMESNRSSGTFGLSSKDQGVSELTVDLNAATIVANDDVYLQSGNNIHLAGTDLLADGDVTLKAVDEVLISAGEVLMQSENWSRSSGLFTNDAVYSKSEKESGDMLSLARASNVEAGGNLQIASGSATVIGSNLHGEESVTIETDIGDIQILAARTSVDTWSKEKEVSVGMGELMENLSRPDQWVETNDGRATMTFAEATYDEVNEHSSSAQVEGSRITSGDGGRIALLSENNIYGEGVTLGLKESDVESRTAPDIAMYAGKDISIVDASETYQSESEEIHGSAEMSVVVQHQAVEIAKAVIALDESVEALKQAKKDYKRYQSDLDNMEKQFSAMEADLAAGVPGINATDLIEMREIIDDMHGDEAWYLTGITLAIADVTSKTTQLAQQTAAGAASVGTWGFNAGVQLDIDASKTTSSVNQTTSVASNIQANNLTMMTGMERTEDENGSVNWQQNQENVAATTTTIRGSNIDVSNTLNIDTGDLLIEAGKNTQESTSNTEQAHITAQVTVYGAAGGASVNASYNRSENTDKSTTWNNSQINADVINIETAGDTTIRGGNVHAESELNADIGGDLWVESKQNRYRSRNLSQGISAGMSFGGNSGTEQNNTDSVNSASGVDGGQQNFDQASVSHETVSSSVVAGANGGITYGSGMSVSRETVRSSLTSGGTANINVEGDTTIVAATIATIDEEGNDLGNLNLSTNTLHYANLRDFNQSNQTSAGISSSVSIGGSGDVTQQTVAKDNDGDDLEVNSSNISYSNTSSYSASNSLATLGNGNIIIHDQENSDSLDGINRDVTDDTYELWDVERQEGNIDLTVDHRLLSEDGRNKIREDFARSRLLGEDILTVFTDEVSLSGSGDSERTLRQQILDSNDAVNALKQFVNGKGDEAQQAVLNYINSDAPLSERQAAYTTLLVNMSAQFGVPPAEVAIVLQQNGSLNTAFYEGTNINQQIMGAQTMIKREVVDKHGEETTQQQGLVFIEGEQNGDSRTATQTLGHEFSHHLGSSRNEVTNTEQGRANSEAHGERMAETFDTFMGMFLAQAGHGGYGNDYTNANLNLNNATIQNNNDLFNSFDQRAFNYRRFNEDETATLTSGRTHIRLTTEVPFSVEFRINQLHAVACAGVDCADGVETDDQHYNTLRVMQNNGEALIAEGVSLDILLGEALPEGQFEYGMGDWLGDQLTSEGEFTHRAEGVVMWAGGSAGAVGGGLLGATSAGACPATGLSCLGVPLGGYLAYESVGFAEQGIDQMLSTYEPGEGHAVINSFYPETHQGNYNPLIGGTETLAWLGFDYALGRYGMRGLSHVDDAVTGYASSVRAADDFTPSISRYDFEDLNNGGVTWTESQGLRHISQDTTPSEINLSYSVYADFPLESGGYAFGPVRVGGVGSEGNAASLDIKQYPDGSYRTPDGKFASPSGVAPPGTVKADEFAKHLKLNGMEVVGTEMVVKGPLGDRRYDIVVRDTSGLLHGIEIKSGSASKNGYQEFTDYFVNEFGAKGKGRIEGEVIESATTVYVP